MKQFSRLSIAVLVIIFITAGCKKTDKTGLYVPKNAAFVLHINSASLSSKLSWKEIKQTEWFADLYKDAPDSFAKKLLDDPDNAGMNTQSHFVFFLKKQAKNNYAVFEGNIKDAKAFEEFNKKMGKTQLVTKDGDINYINFNDKAVAVWGDIAEVQSPGGVKELEVLEVSYI